ncbi:MAG: putative multidrug resistance protein EmrK [bacterium ADurb.Bin429]|nr:MAG: putative multidrug resistance protein EmrK [bacterium ADurb.Bin429]
MEQARAQARAAQAALDLVEAGARPQTIAAVRARVESAQGTLKTALASERQTTILAPTDGRVMLRAAEVGELVTPGMPILKIAELNHVLLRVYVPEPLIEKVKIGQPARITTDAGTVYHGTVTEIAEEPEFAPKNVQTKEERVKLVFGVKIEVENPERALKPGMPADAVIEVE